MSNKTNSIATTNNTTIFDFNAPSTISSENRGALGNVSVWKRSFLNEKGELTEIELTDKALVASASRLDTLLAMREFSSLGVCYELSILASNKEKFGFKSIGEIGAKLFNLKSATSTQYARVGKLFVDCTTSENGTKYALKTEYKGATVTNLVQILSLVDEKSDNPLEKVIDAIANDKLHLNGTLANIKKEVKAISNGEELTEDGKVIIDSKAKEISSVKSSVADSLSVLLAECEKLTEEKKEIAISHITALQEIFTNLNVAIEE